MLRREGKLPPKVVKFIKNNYFKFYQSFVFRNPLPRLIQTTTKNLRRTTEQNLRIGKNPRKKLA